MQHIVIILYAPENILSLQYNVKHVITIESDFCTIINNVTHGQFYYYCTYY